MADFSDIFGRVQNYQQRTQSGGQGIGGIGAYESRFGPVRQAYHERLEAERRRKMEADARKWFDAAARNEWIRNAQGVLNQPSGGGGGGGAGYGGRRIIRSGGIRSGGGKSAGGSALDRFMYAISGQESGHNYNARNPDSGASGRFQIMPANWGPWSREVFGRVVARTPQNQDKVARYKMNQYYRQFGRWDLVARAWYAGPGSVKYSQRALSRPQGRYPSINEYVWSVMRRMR